ncbi:DNA polymerase eta, putative isoform 3 [Hibiscus syriacus]|uniref:DNA polymerase eta n=1 Tax=Hibiscus syriacus TaxID=106335 RepID=A0A6A2YT38_HIBSY|nr:DNA polymerase eta, putative isoform 3 [Hibiscus syriacus]
MQRLDFDLARLPIWLHLFNVPLELYNQADLSYIFSTLGTPISMDNITASKTRLYYAKVCVEIGVKEEILKLIKVELANGQTTNIYVKIPWLASRCSKCISFGHSDKNFPSHQSTTPQTKQIWRKKIVSNSISDTVINHHNLTEKSPKAPNDDSSLSSVNSATEGKQPTTHSQSEESDKVVNLPLTNSPFDKDQEPTSFPKRGRGRPIKVKTKVALKGSANRFKILITIYENSPIAEAQIKKTRPAASGVANLLKELKAKKKEQITRIKTENYVNILHSKFGSWNALTNYEFASNGRIWLLWKKGIDICYCNSSDQSITVKCSFNNISFILSAIYVNNNDISKRHIWQHLRDLNSHFNSLPWILGGDFNSFLHYKESSDSDLLGTGPLEKELSIQNELAALEEAEKLFLRQKSKVKWFKEGDKCSKYFHSVMATKNKNDTIRVLINAQGKRLESFEDKSSEALEFFKHQLGTIDPNLQQTDPHFLKNLLQFNMHAELSSDLVKNISNEEIKEAIFSQGNDKSPGPDGFTPLFFKRSWSVVGDDVTKAIRFFFEEAFILPAFNSAIIALIPKTHNPSSIKDYRLISCCSVVYKTISKILVKRLTTLLPAIITPNQSAFVRGRSIIDNTLLAQELVRGYEKKLISPRHIGLPITFLNWIEVYLKEAKYYISFNGSSVGYFKGQRGIRQRDPLSPILFVPAMNILSKILNLAASKGIFGYHPKCIKIGLTHLSFVDDLLIFCKGNLDSIAGIISVLNHFYSLSGLKLNVSKTELFAAGISSRNLEIIHAISDFKIGQLPVSVANLWCRQFMLPQFIINQIDQLYSRFLWKGTDQAASGARVKDPFGWLGCIVMFLKNNDFRDMVVNNAHSWSTKKLLKLRHSAFPILNTRTICSKEIWEAVRERKSKVSWHKIIWFPMHVPKFSTIAWMAILDRLPTRERLSRMGVLNDTQCVLCNETVKTRNHLFADCSFAKNLWQAILNLTHLRKPQMSWESMLEWVCHEWRENVRKWINSHNADHRDKLLACGILIVAVLRMQVFKETEFTCSAGIAHNKMLAKLASGMNKPAQQTVVPSSPLGVKLGISSQNDMGVNTVGDLLQFPEEKLLDRYGVNTGKDPPEERTISRWFLTFADSLNNYLSMVPEYICFAWDLVLGCGTLQEESVEKQLRDAFSPKAMVTFPGPRALKAVPAVQHWLIQLCEELSERICSDLDQNKRMAHTLTLHARAYKHSSIADYEYFYSPITQILRKSFAQKSCPLRYGTAKIQEDGFNLFQAGLREYVRFYGVKTQGNHYSGWGITSLSVSASKIVPIPSGTCSIAKYFHGQSTSHFSSMQPLVNFNAEASVSLPPGSECFPEVNSPKAEVDFPKEESWIEDTVPDLDLQEQKLNFLKDEVLTDLPSSLSKMQDGFTQGISPSLLSGSLEQNQNKQKRDITKDEGQFKSEYKERKGKRLKDKGTPPILELFKSYNPNPSGSSVSQELKKTAEGSDTRLTIGFETKGHSLAEQNEGEKEKPMNSSGSSYSRDEGDGRREAWSYNIDEIDLSAVDELPPEIQDEIKAWVHPHKWRPNNTVKRGLRVVRGQSLSSHYGLTEQVDQVDSPTTVMCNDFNAIMGRHSSATPYDMYQGRSTNNPYDNIASSSRGRHSSANPFDLNMEMPSTQPSVQFPFDAMASSSRGRHSTTSFFDLNVDMPSSSRGRRASSRFFDLNVESMEELSSPPEEPLREPGVDGAETGLFIDPESPQFNSDDDEVPGNVAQTDPPAHMYEADYGAMYGPKFTDMPHLGDYGYYSSINNGVNQDHPNLDSEVICQAIMPMVKASSHIAVVVLISAIQSQYGYIVSYKKAWLAKQNAIVKLHGEWDVSYNELPGWFRLVRTLNPRTIVDFETSYAYHNDRVLRDRCQFYRVFWSYPQCVNAIKFCKPAVQIDGTFLYGKYKQVLLLVVIQDGNRNILPVAFALVEGEDTTSWAFFLRNLRAHVITRENICVISDRGAGIKATMESLGPMWQPPFVQHRYCLRHIAANYHGRYKNNDERQLIVRMGYELLPRTFESMFQELRAKNEEGYDYISLIDKEMWTNAYDGGYRYGHTTTNLAEVINSTLKGARHLPVAVLVNTTYFHLGALFAKPGGQAQTWMQVGHVYHPRLVADLQKKITASNGMSVTSFSRRHEMFRVTELPRPLQGIEPVSLRVNLRDRTCDCGFFQALKYPCSHVIATCSHTRQDYNHFVDPVYLLSEVFKVYEFEFPPIGNNKDPDEVQDWLPIVPNSSLLRERGRPKSNRIHYDMDIRERSRQDKRCGHCRNP